MRDGLCEGCVAVTVADGPDAVWLSRTDGVKLWEWRVLPVSERDSVADDESCRADAERDLD